MEPLKLKLKLRKKSFYVRSRRFIGWSKSTKRPLYDLCAEKVCGEVFTYLGKDFGVYRTEHTVDRRRKYDYVVIDLACGMVVCIGARRIDALAMLQSDYYTKRLESIFSKEFYEIAVKEFNKLKGAVAHEED